MKRGKAKRKSPSREKYERNNPVVSHRVPKELHDRLQAAKEKEGLSYTDILKMGLGLLEPKIRAEKEVRAEAYHQGHIRGYTLAESVYKITYPCSICKEMIEVRAEETKRAIRRFLINERWGHAACHDR